MLWGDRRNDVPDYIEFDWAGFKVDVEVDWDILLRIALLTNKMARRKRLSLRGDNAQTKERGQNKAQEKLVPFTGKTKISGKDGLLSQR